MFSREHEVIRWYTNIPQDPDGISSYALDVAIQSTRWWRDPIALSRVLKCFTRVKTLTIAETRVPSSEVDNIVSSGEFGREITTLNLISPLPAIPTLMSLILSFPNLTELMIDLDTQPGPPNFNPSREDLTKGTSTIATVVLVSERGDLVHRVMWNHVAEDQLGC